MIGDVGVHRANHADVVDAVPHVREDLADFDPALAPLPKRERRLERGARATLGLQVQRHRLAVHPRQFGLGVERVDLRGPAIQEDVDDPLGPGLKLRCLGQERIDRAIGPADGSGEQARIGHESAQGERAETHRRAAEQLAARQEQVGQAVPVMSHLRPFAFSR
jgi:hypothetical protein